LTTDKDYFCTGLQQHPPHERER